ncbi:F-actin-monooxygenase Mical isoform X1 [Vespa crabro]|uniref:F-actin-monooxygenase Mical isoform X1 n=1 Tax=Vespa crabro TaxID=7445 RepID=UPI001F02217E|nr:F-actin-monooxygenase Mical isoform X1 [Vespa crabro]XP_046822761.1 F-actin-monooxygenase Mical isoform X1 [Vespa crabro]XP_046822762.1 F-actin-monooxygenase Mical isoform X1 [Vespa crabro]XP_046822763.1 F-actin-monooxygenase Mical isoform X1 [Vespa crabro]XP_046822764.1 F-actin-monooxygenase Mical isoform X1 [Vespa crabro]
MDQQQQQSSKKYQTTANSPEAAIASEVFDQFCNATTLKSILGHYRHLCELLKIKPNTINQFYPKLKSKLRSWKAQALWKKFDQRANHKCYNRGKACPNTRVLIIGGGPCGLRSAIEAQLLGAKVVVVEKRDRMSRNNVLHLWPFVIQDLRGLGAKKFFGKFCAGSIDHISIRQLQCILLKVALILGVEFHESVSFESLISPPDNQEEAKIGWRAKTSPADHPVSQYEFDVLIGADGKRNTLEGFKRKEFRGKLAIAITANFINKRTEAEARVEEISGVAFIFNQKFFKELYQETGIDLENIVYYKDDTHYFVMTAKKHSLIDKGVILQDHADTAKLLAKENVDREALMLYAREAAEFSTEYQMMDMEFAVNHYGQPDVAMFDFTSMYAAENASRVLHHNGHRLLMILVGDSLLEPFWPTGSGCARGFLSSLDACWAIKGWGTSLTPLEVIAERESIYRLLGQTTPENLNRDYAAYTLDPHTRYPNLNSHSVTPAQVLSLVDTDDPEIIKQPAVQAEIDIPKKRRRRDLRADSQVHPDVLLRWLQKQVALYEGVHIEDMGASFKSGLAICAIIHRYRPDLIDFYSLQTTEAATNNQLAFDILEKELGISPIMTGEEMSQCDVPDKLAMFSYLTQIYEVFRKEIPHIKHPKLELDNEEISSHLILSHLTTEQKAQLLGHIVKQESATRTRHSRLRQSSENIQQHGDKKGDTISRRSRKRRSMEKIGATVEERLKRLDEIEKNRVEHMKRRQFLRKMATQQFYKSMQMLQANAKRERDEPFEDYSIFLYRQTAPDFKDRVKDLEQKILHPDRESKLHASHHRYGIDEEFSGRIKNIEHKLKGSGLPEKKPRDLLRAIGKIEKTDWNIKEIERKIEENKMGHGVRHDKVERVPKWSREQFLARQIKMEKKGHDPKDVNSKYAEIDNTLKSIDKKIKEGSVLGHNKVSAMAEQFSSKTQDTEPKVQKSNTKTPLTLPAQGGSEMCHFCNKRVYLMERLSAEGKYFHRGCFRCEYCSTSLRIGNHTYDRLKNGGRFYCTQHFGLSGTMKGRIEKKKSTVNKENVANTSANTIVPEKINIQTEGVVGLDLLDRGQTPERIEFENLARVSDTEEAHSQMDEDEWTDRNFGASAAEMGSSDDISDMSDSDDDNEVFEEAIDQPLTTEGTLELAKNWTLRYSNSQNAAGQSDTGSNEYEDSSDEYTSEEDESSTATEDEDDARARELRKQEVWLPVPPMSSDTDTGSETEVASDDGSTEESEENSATEISTDSEFEHDGVTPTRHEIPEITINDAYVRKTRGNYVEPKKVQVKSKIISSINGKFKQEKDSEGKVDSGDLNPTKKTIQETKTESKSPMLGSNFNTNNLSPLINPRKGDYLLNRTHSTEGIASKLSLELKKRYLLGGPALGGSVMKSGSTSNVDTKLRSLTDAISQHQKLLNPAPEPSPTMQAFLQGTSKLHLSNSQLSPLSPTMLFSSQSIKPLSVNQVSKINPNNGSYEHKTASGISDPSKIHLPDLVTETSILKSRTAPNVSESMKDAEKKQIEEKISPKTNDTNTKSLILENVNAQNTEKTHSTGLDENISCRPRSPLHETSIIVPEVHWVKNKEELKEADSTEDSEIDSDSLSLSDVEIEEDNKGEQLLTANLSPPRLQIHSTDGDLLLDESIEKNKVLDICSTFEPDSIECSIFRDEQSNNEQIVTQLMQSSLNNDKLIEVLNNKIEECDLHDNNKQSISSCSSPASVASAISNKQDDSEENDVTTTAALTETEFSEWARDGQDLVSYDLQDTDFDINPEFVTKRKNSNLFYGKSSVCNTSMMKRENPENTQAYTYKSDKRTELPSNNTSELLANGENIDYMDTDNESLLDDSLQDATNTALLKNRGYVEFVNIKTIDSLRSNITDAPIATLECENDICSEEEIVNNENIIEINPVTMDDVMNKLNGATNSADNKPQESSISNNTESRTVQEAQIISEAINNDSLQSMDEDSLLIVEPAEDTTTSEVITILASPVNPQKSIVPKEEVHEQIQQGKTLADSSNPDYLEYVKRLQSRIAEFSNAKDSIDVRKSKRKNSKNLAQTRTAELIAEEIRNQESFNNNNLNSPATSRKLEEITRERSKQKNVIEDLLMDKLVAHKQKSAEKKARRAARASSFSSVLSPMKLPTIAAITTNNTSATKFVPTSLETQISNTTHNMTFADAKKILQTEQSLSVDSNISSQKTENNESTSYKKSTNQAEKYENSASSNLHSEMDKDFKTPIAPPRFKHEEAKRTTEKARQDARERARLKSDEDLGLSPEDKIKELKMKFARRQHSVEERRKTEDIVSPEIKSRSFSFTINKPGSKLQTSKSTDNMKAITKKMNLKDVSTISAKSMDELSKATNASNSDNVTGGMKGETKKPKDPERRKSIIQAVSDFFFKKEASVSPQKDKLSMFRLTSKSKGKLYKSYSDGSDIDKVDSTKLKARPKSVCESMLIGNYLNENPPAIPPPPQDYINVTTHISDDSLSEDDTKTAALSTSQVQKAIATEGSCNSISRKTKTMRKLTRQAQLKRLRMAQEIQRKLEETEVKQRELESRGVSVEKALRGEGDCSDREEADLLREWFDLMKERTELRRYEKELLVRAQEVQLEDRHERLQQELRERLADDDEKKTSADVEKEGEILTEMLEIVEKRDTLIALLEEERQRYQDEDRDLEAQMLAKGLRLIPMKKVCSKYSV